MTIENGRAQFFDLSGTPAGTLAKKERISPTAGATPPAGAIVLFDERVKSLEHFNGAKLTKEGYLHSGLLTKMKVGDFRLHLEFRTPYMPYARGQARANSGVYIQQRYELQILDSFGLKGEFNECGALYRQQTPEFNMCYPPLSWQTYDLYFTAARFADGKKTAPRADHRVSQRHGRAFRTVDQGQDGRREARRARRVSDQLAGPRQPGRVSQRVDSVTGGSADINAECAAGNAPCRRVRWLLRRVRRDRQLLLRFAMQLTWTSDVSTLRVARCRCEQSRVALCRCRARGGDCARGSRIGRGDLCRRFTRSPCVAKSGRPRGAVSEQPRVDRVDGQTHDGRNIVPGHRRRNRGPD